MDFSNLKNVVSGLVSNVSQKGRELAGTAADKAKSASRIAKLSMELSNEKDSLKRTFATMGETYYENREDPSSALLAQLCEEADSTKERISAIEAELAQLKSDFSQNKDADVEVSFEVIVEEGEKDACAEECTEECTEECEEECTEAAEEVIDEIKETVEEIVEATEDAVEDATKEITED